MLLLEEFSIDEFKWNKLKEARSHFLAIKLIDYLIFNISKLDFRIDTLIWDTQDERHSISGRDDNANFERMYFKLLKVAIEKRPITSDCHIFLDEKSGVNWDSMNKCLDSVGNRKVIIDYPIFNQDDFYTNYSIKEFRQVSSIKCFATSVPDLFGGLSVFSIISYKEYKIWEQKENKQLLLLDREETINFSKSKKFRFPVMKHLEVESKKRKLGVSINTMKRFHTFKPSNPINFWFYEPQHKNDKAPTK